MRFKITKKNFPTVINVLKNIMEFGAIEIKHEYSFKGYKESKVSNEHKDYFRKAKVTKHWLAGKAGVFAGQASLIHISFLDESNFLVLCEGDIIDLKNGSCVVIRQESPMIKNVLKETSLTTVFKKAPLEKIEQILIEREKERADENEFYESMMNGESELEEESWEEDDFDDLD